MKFALIAASLARAFNISAADAPRTIAEYPEARELLRCSTTLQFYRGVLHAPIDGWATVRGDLAGDRLLAPRVVRSDTNRVFAREHRGPRSYAFFEQERGVPPRYRGTAVPMQPGFVRMGDPR